MPVLARAETLAAIAALRRCIAVAGTHGKTTTASMLALLLVEAGLRPSFIIGGDVNEIGTNAAWDDGEWLVVEADESDGTFLELAPESPWSPTWRPTTSTTTARSRRVRAAFEDVPGRRPAAPGGGRRRPGGRPPSAGRPGPTSVGTGAGCTYRMVGLSRPAVRSPSTCWDPTGAVLGHLSVPVPGLHNARNAAVAAVAALAAGVPFEAAARALARFAGVARRFEFRGEPPASPSSTTTPTCPTEVAAALAAARMAAGAGWWPSSSPTATPGRPRCGSEFGGAFADADVVVVTDVYGAGEAPVPGVSGRWWPTPSVARRPRCRALRARSARPAARWRASCCPGDLCLTLGAGDLTSLPDELMAAALVSGTVSDPPSDELAALAAAAGPRRPTGTIPWAPARPTGSGGTAALFVEAADEADLAGGGPGPGRAGACRSWWWASGSNLLVADRGFAGLVVVLGPAFEDLSIDGTEVRAGGGGRPAGAGPPHRLGRARPAWSGRSGCRARSAGRSG